MIEQAKERLSGKGNGGALEIKKEDISSGFPSFMDRSMLLHQTAKQLWHGLMCISHQWSTCKLKE